VWLRSSHPLLFLVVKVVTVGDSCYGIIKRVIFDPSNGLF
jgi:hypothetical protein